MKKFRQLLAILGIIVLVGLYATTLICAFSANENFMGMLMASIYASIVIPVILWAFTHFSGLFNKQHKDDTVSSDESEES